MPNAIKKTGKSVATAKTKSNAKDPAAEIGIIGGSGLYAMGGLTNTREIRVKTPFGDPSDAFVFGMLEGKRVAFLARHGRGHRFMPGELNFRANIYAMKLLGVQRIISVSAVGSLRENLRPGEFLVPDQFFDSTKGRASTFFGNGIVAHVTFDKPTCTHLSTVLADACCSTAVPVHRKGTYICMEGPQFSTLAEANFHRSMNFDVIGMTNVTEAKLAREAEIPYAAIAMVTDYDCWHEEHESVDVASVLKVARENAARANALVKRVLTDFPEQREPCRIGSDRALDGAIMTAPAARDPALMAKLDAIAGRVLRGPAA